MADKKIYNVRTRSVAAVERRALKSGMSVSVGGGSSAGGDTYVDLSGYLPRVEFDEMFEWAERADGERYIKAKAGLTADWLSAPGAFNGNAGGGGTGGASRLVDLTDVTISTLRNGDALVWDGSKWVNAQIDSGLDVSALASYLISNGYLKGDALSDYATRTWVTGQGYLTEHQDLTGLLPRTEFEAMFEWAVRDNGERYIKAKAGVSAPWLSAPGEFNGTPDTIVGATALRELTDVRLSGLAAGQTLVYNGAFWVNRAVGGGLDEAELASYLTTNNYVTAADLSGYVTLNTEQTISGKKTFAFDETVFTKKIRIDGDSTGFGFLPTLLFHIPNLEWSKFVMNTDGSLNLVSGGATDWSLGNYKPLNTGYHTIITGTGTVKIGSQNSSFIHYESSGPIHWFNKNVSTNGDFYARNAGGGGHIVWHAGNDGPGSTLDADLLDGRHSYDLVAREYSLVAAGESITWQDWLKRNGNNVALYTRSGWGWAQGGIINVGFEDINTESYSALVYRQGDLNGAWQMSAAMFIPAYTNTKFIYLARATTTATAGVIQSPSVLRFADYDTIVNGNVASATKLQTARNIFGISFNGENDVVGRFELDGNTGGCLSIYDGGTFRTIQTWDNKPLVLNSQGNNVGIGTTSPRYKFDVNGDIIADGWIRTTGDRGWYNETHGGGWYMIDTTWIRAFNGKSVYTPANLQVDGTISNGAGIYSSQYVSAKGNAGSSDIRLKNNLQPFALALRDIAGAPLVTFDWRDGSGRDIGSVAQYWLTRCPLAVLTAPDGYYSIDYGKLATAIGVSIARVVETHEERLTKIERRLTDECK